MSTEIIKRIDNIKINKVNPPTTAPTMYFQELLGVIELPAHVQGV